MMKFSKRGLKARSSIYISFFWFLGWFVICRSISAQVQNIPADESGTLVMVARTRAAIIISADSEVHSSDGVSYFPTLRSEGRRKLVNVGKTGACAIDGWLGDEVANIDVAISLRNWVKSHPTAGPVEAINDLLRVAAGTWDREGYLPGQITRKIGKDITTLTCGDIVSGQPVIVKGQTYLRNDYSAEYKKLDLDPGAVLYVDGVIQTSELRTLILGVVASDNSQALIQINEDLRFDTQAVNAFKISKDVEMVGPQSSEYDNAWTPKTVRQLFNPVFETVERNMSENVGPPNNVRIITSCGRMITTVEADPWPTCPAATMKATPKPQKKVN